MNSNNPLISVVIPTYNCSQFIISAIHSVLDQSYENYEIIIVDDGSTDNTKEVLKPYIEEKKIQYVFQNNLGPSAARNKGIKLSKGEYIAFLDADDLWIPGKLEKQVNFLDNNKNLGLVFSDTSIFDEGGVISDSFLRLKKNLWKIPTSSDSKNGRVFLRNIFEDLIEENFIPTKTVLIRKKCIDELGYFDETLFSVEDRDMWLRIAQTYGVGFINEPLAKKRQHKTNIGSNQQLALESQLRVINKMLEIYPQLPPSNIKLIDRSIRDLHFSIGYMLFCERNLKQSRGHFVQSINDGRFDLRRYLYLMATFMPLKLIDLIKRVKTSLR